MVNVAVILRALYNKPAFVTEDYANAVITALENKELRLFQVGKSEEGKPTASAEGKALVAEIEGGLSYKPYGMCPGLNSYTEMVNLAREVASNPEYSMLVLMVDSPGGMAYQCFESAKLAKKILNESGKQLITYVDGMACSAMYAWAAVSDEVIANPMASVGSIGVVIAIKNTLPKEIKDGNEVLFITSGANKVPFDTEGYFKKDQLEKLQKQVTKLGEQFISHVASYRNLTEDAVRDMEAESFSASEALSLGLIDKIMEKDEFFSYLSNKLEKQNKEKLSLEDNIPTMADYTVITAKLAELEKANAELAARNETLNKDNVELSAFVKAAADKEKSEALAKFASTLEGYSFIDNAQAMASALASFEAKEMVLAAFSQAHTLLQTSEKQKAESNSEMFQQKSMSVEDTELLTEGNVIDMAESFLVQKYNKGEAK